MFAKIATPQLVVLYVPEFKSYIVIYAELQLMTYSYIVVYSFAILIIWFHVLGLRFWHFKQQTKKNKNNFDKLTNQNNSNEK